MTLEGGINFNETADYTIYTMNSPQTGQYCTILPKNTTATLNMLVDLHKKTSFDKITNGSITKEQLIEELSKEYVILKEKYPNSILVFPMMNEEILTSAINNNDKQKMFDETKKIGAITSELYKKLIDSGVEKQKINQQIMMIEKNNQDIQFVNWLKEQMPNFVEGINYSELEPKAENTNPFMNLNPFTQEPATPTEPPKPTPTSIFDNVAPKAPEPPVAPIEPTPSSATEPIPQNNPFDGGTTNLFPTPELSSTPKPVPEPSTPEPAPFFEAPKPVQNQELEATMTLNQLSESQPIKEETAPEEEEKKERKANQGFANLIILVVILIGVTIASIELGKFLYSVYGA